MPISRKLISDSEKGADSSIHNHLKAIVSQDHKRKAEQVISVT
jgi:hypothetical protein